MRGAVSTISGKVVKVFLKISNESSDILEPLFHAIQATFYRDKPLLRRGGSAVSHHWREAANEMVLFRVFTRGAHEFRYAACIASVADKKVV